MKVGEIENERLKHPFSHVERHLDLQKIPQIDSHSKIYITQKKNGCVKRQKMKKMKKIRNKSL
jgi:hypothetical protein